MTTFDRFDPFERRITDAIDEIAAARMPDYLDDLLRQTARTSQRPRWTFPERWLPMDTALSRPTLFGRLPFRQLIVLALLVALAAAALAVYVGQQRRLPAPFGLAGNGTLAYSFSGDIYVRDTPTSPGRLLVGGPGVEDFAGYTPDGSHLTYVSIHDGADHLMVANADGTNPVEIAVIPSTGNATGAISPDGKTFALVYDIGGIPTLSMVAMDGSSSRVIDLNPKWPLEVSWSPPNGDLLLIRAQDEIGEGVALYTLKPDGSGLSAFNLPGTSGMGMNFTLSGAVWAPDGRTIAYNGVDQVRLASGETRDHFRVHLIAPDGSNDRAVPGPEEPLVQENWPTYSPDGKWIVVHRWDFIGDKPNAEGWLAIMPADGSAPARDIGPRIPGGQDTGLSKTWSPDGSRLLMSTANTEQVYSIDPVTGEFEQLTWATTLPDWQRVALP
jgi:Tol biopolymer transport system component